MRARLLAQYRRLHEETHPEREFLIADDVDELLARASTSSPGAWCVVHSEGTIFDFSLRPAQRIENFLKSLDAQTTLTAGHLIDKPGQYCGLHEQTVIVQLDTYHRLGRPVFGGYERTRRTLSDYHSGPSIHDGYTPTFIRPTGATRDSETWTCGWGLVNASLSAGLEISNLPDDVRRTKTFLYPDDGTEHVNACYRAIEAMKTPLAPTQKRALRYFFYKKMGIARGHGRPFGIEPRKGAIFAFNTERMDRYHAEMRALNRPLDTYVGTCAGFLDFAGLFKRGFHPRTRLILFDVSSDAVTYKRALWQTFDGRLENLGSWFSRFTKENPNVEFLSYDLATEVARLEETFGSAETFQKTWQAARQLDREFLELNLICDFERLLKKIPNEGESLLVISDIFLGQNELSFGVDLLRERLGRLLDLSSQKPGLFVQGADLRNEPFLASGNALLEIQ